jgi:hypothetical protein
LNFTLPDQIPTVLAASLVHRVMKLCSGVFAVHRHLTEIRTDEQSSQHTRLCCSQDNTYLTPLHAKPVGIIAHGGQTEEALPYYKTALPDPLANAFASVQMREIGAGEQWPNGVTFGIQSLILPSDSIFVTIQHDYQAIRQRIQELVENVIAAIYPLE